MHFLGIQTLISQARAHLAPSAARGGITASSDPATASRPSVDEVVEVQARLHQRLATTLDGPALTGPVQLSAVVARDLCTEMIDGLARLGKGELTGKEAGLFYALASSLAAKDETGSRGWSIKNAQVRIVASAASQLCRAVGLYEGFLPPNPDGTLPDALQLLERNGEASAAIRVAIGWATAPPSGHGVPNLLETREDTVRIYNQILDRVDQAAVSARCRLEKDRRGPRLS